MSEASTPYATHLRGFQGFPAALGVPCPWTGTYEVLNLLTLSDSHAMLEVPSKKPSVVEGFLKKTCADSWTDEAHERTYMINLSQKIVKVKNFVAVQSGRPHVND